MTRKFQSYVFASTANAFKFSNFSVIVF